MKNRAKCKLCNSVIESFHSTDYVHCKCGHISVSGGDAMYCAANDWANFVRVDDAGREIVVTVAPDATTPAPEPTGKPSKAELMGYLDDMIKSYEMLPDQVRDSFVTSRDYESLLILISAILKAE